MIGNVVETERCVCGHTRLTHGLKKGLVPYSGPCMVNKCRCFDFTWDGYSGPYAEVIEGGKTLDRESVCL